MSKPIDSQPPARLSFKKVATGGFGDRHNSWAWSMQWWRGKLYVGTNRSWLCAERAGINSVFPKLLRYPPNDPDLECPPDPVDLPLQAEIWRWTPEPDEWERVYQSPQDVPIPKRKGKFVARDIGFRHMALFNEPSGTEAMYISGVNAKFIFRPIPPPRLLRSTDGLTFDSIPQTPGTLLGDLKGGSFRTITVIDDRMFVIAGNVAGDGILLLSANPAQGDDHFQVVSPPKMQIFEMALFNGFLYCGVRDGKRGYAIVKAEITSGPPYRFTPVVTDGAFLPQPSRGVISMHVFKDRLYIGTDRPAAEVIRVNPDDSWDLVIGTARKTPNGWKYPISGLDSGFNNSLTGHIWRIQEYAGRLYIGTWDMSTEFHTAPGADAVLRSTYGFNLFATTDGSYYEPITTTGFDDAFNHGLRTFAMSPYGLFIGTANPWYGLQIWRGIADNAEMQPTPTELSAGRGWIHTISPKQTPIDKAQESVSTQHVKPLPPEHLEIEQDHGRSLLSWEHARGARSFHILRAFLTDERQQIERNTLVASLLKILRVMLALKPSLYFPPLPETLWIPGPFEEIGQTEFLYFEDKTIEAGAHYLYLVRAEDQEGMLSSPSNMVALPTQSPPVTFDSLLEMLERLAASQKKLGMNGVAAVSEQVARAQAAYRAEEFIEADNRLQEILVTFEAEEHPTLTFWTANDLQLYLAKLRRRIALSRSQILSSASVQSTPAERAS